MSKPATRPEFDKFSGNYDDLLKDPLRDRFTGAASDFFHVRKRDLIRSYFQRRGSDTKGQSYLDLGCGQGELARLLKDDFAQTCGCDPSEGMLQRAQGIETRLQTDPGAIPYPDASFHFVTAVCVYHHIPVQQREALTAEVARVLKPGGVFAIIEHNPHNPVTRAIVKRAPVDADAVLLKPNETKRLLRSEAFELDRVEYFLFLPEKLYRRFGALEGALQQVPLGGQYAAFGSRRRA